AGPAGGAPCCPDVQSPDAAGSHRLQEYFPLLRAHDDPPRPVAQDKCVACTGGAPVGPGPVELSSLAASEGAGMTEGTPSGGSVGFNGSWQEWQPPAGPASALTP